MISEYFDLSVRPLIGSIELLHLKAQEEDDDTVSSGSATEGEPAVGGEVKRPKFAPKAKAKPKACPAPDHCWTLCGVTDIGISHWNIF